MNGMSWAAVGKTLKNIDNEEKDVAKFFIFITVIEKEEFSGTQRMS